MIKCFKEWNAIVEALGQGKQTILVRKNATLQDKFLIYPTVSYALKEDHLNSFKESEKQFVENHLLPLKNNDEMEIKYFAKVEKVKKISPNRLGSLKRYHIWNEDHIKDYLNNRKGYVWLLRVYELPKPYFGKTKKQAITFAKLNKNIKLEGSKPVINDNEFKKILENFE